MPIAEPPRLIFIFGPAAVGKMTVGQHLRDLTGFKLLYNHMVVDLVTEFFPFGTEPFHALARPITLQLIEACATNGASLIITHGLLFDAPGSRRVIEDWSAPYHRVGGEVFYAELSAPLDVRLERNATDNGPVTRRLSGRRPNVSVRWRIGANGTATATSRTRVDMWWSRMVR